MSETKPLTPAMQAALDACPFTATFWGAKCMGGLPSGVTMKSVNALVNRGLVTRRFTGAFERTFERIIPAPLPSKED